MKPFIVALAAGLLVGVIYGIINVRSPAPPYVALIGLLGILLGEHAVNLVKARLAPPPAGIAGLAPAGLQEKSDAGV